MALIPGTLPTGTKYPNDPQSLLDTFASFLNAPETKKNRPTVSEYSTVNGVTINANTSGVDETIFLNHATDAAASTVTLPTDATSVVGQTVRVFASRIVTTFTVSASGLTIYGTAVTTLTAGQCVAYQKVAALKWIRIQ